MNKKIKFGIFFLVSLPKTLFFDFVALPLPQAIKLPILIGWNTKLKNIKRGIIQFDPDCHVTPCMVRIGFGGSDSVPTLGRGIVNITSGKILFKGQTCFAAGSSLDVCGEIEFGKNFSTNKNSFISCSKRVVIGNDVMLGWNVKIYDAAGHTVYYDGIPHNSQGDIIIGNHVWLCSESHLLKGAKVGDGSIVAWRSTVTKDFFEKGILIAGSPAIVKKRNVAWGPYVQ